jgi:GNAT superfamily N-acetyltransferase
MEEMRIADEYGFYELNPFPGNNQVVVCNHVLIYPEHRGKGRGVIQHESRYDTACALGYDLMICTVRADNEVEKHILTKFGWKFATRFQNRETGNLVEMWTRELNDKLDYRKAMEDIK